MNLKEQRKSFGDECLVNTDTAAAFLGVSNQWLRMSRMKHAQWEGPVFVKVSKRAVKYKIGDLDLFVEQRRVLLSSESVEAGAA
jgi:hypothetical protein